jgi:hypothetical protein
MRCVSALHAGLCESIITGHCTAQPAGGARAQTWSWAGYQSTTVDRSKNSLQLAASSSSGELGLLLADTGSLVRTVVVESGEQRQPEGRGVSDRD